ncbi:DMT family transporter [Magnetospira sp. QH-2]|uniref:DMT family transporter n=1 Tax=Magnetospira sp. (strain QH-2) TaxID=1288970 RepID=UPI0003E81A79|nr:DMT family transporter [Magnetospira sp. QH-2]CCQ73221.1 Conserved membrane protein of unknown function [Magnetospira sp. QH-2]
MARLPNSLSDPDQRVFLAALIGSTFLMGASFIAGKALLARADPFPLTGWRFLVAGVATLPLVYWDLRAKGLGFRAHLFPPPDQWPVILFVGLVQTGLVMGLLFLSMQTLSASTSAILLFTNPLWVGLAAPFLLGERLTVLAKVGLVIGVIGVAFAVGGGHLSHDPTGYVLGLGGGLAFACATLGQKKFQVRVRPFVLAFWQMLIGGSALLLAAAVTGHIWIGGLQGADWATFLWLAIPSSTGSFGLWAVALSKGGAARSSGFLFLVPLFAVLLSVLILQTPIEPRQLLGGLMIGFAIWAINRRSKSRQRA